MQHLTSDQLVALGDRSSSTVDKEHHHLKSCALCHREHVELETRRIQLRNLPLRSPTRSAWPSVRKHIRRQRAIAFATKSGASAVALALCLSLVWVQYVHRGDSEEDLTSDLVAESQHLERVLENVETHAVTDLSQVRHIVALEQQIGDVDDEIAIFQRAGRGQQSSPLWNARVELLRTLVQMHQPTTLVSL